MPTLPRRAFFAAVPLAAAPLSAAFAHAAERPAPGGQPAPGAGGPSRGGLPDWYTGPAPDWLKAADTHRGPVCIASGNGLRAVQRARELIDQGFDPADAIVAGVKIIEDDPEDMSVGFGGLPNEDGVVELDASVMYGPTHKSGAVASLRNIKNPAAVALMVLRRTNHCLIVGDGALRFAREMGFPEENLLTERARVEWLKWKERLGKGDFRLDDDERDPPVGKTFDPRIGPEKPDAAPEPRRPSRRDEGRGGDEVMHLTGTVHCSAVTPAGDVASCTSTSGLSWKIPGRVGDSPIIGAGNYCENAVGAAGCTGRGESCIANLSAYTMVSLMERGLTPTQACLEAARRMAERTLEKRLRDSSGQPNFNVSFYACRKDGAFGGASLRPGGSFAVSDSAGSRVLKTVPLVPGS